MNILGWILFGLIAGVLAKWMVPGPNPGGILSTILLGIAGAVVGGLLASVFGLGHVTGFSFASFLIAVPGALLLLWMYRRMRTS